MSTGTLGRGSVRADSVIEPRLRARRIEVARDRGRRRLRRFALVGVVVLFLVAVVALTQSPVLDVDRVAVGGAGARRADVLAASGISPGDPLIGVDAGASANRIEALPWVQEASVARRWPGSVTIEVTRRVPVATVGDDDGAAVEVDADGWAIGPASEARPLPLVDDDPIEPGTRIAEVVRERAEVAGDLPASLRSEVAEIERTSAGLVLHLDDDIAVVWGDASQASAKADALQVLLDEADRETIDEIDVSVPRAATLTRKTEAE